jgi:hypothetical protein
MVLLASLTEAFTSRLSTSLVTLPIAGYDYGGNWTISTGRTSHPLDRQLASLHSNRVFKDHSADACQNAWRRLLNEPGRIASIATRDWAIIGQSL